MEHELLEPPRPATGSPADTRRAPRVESVDVDPREPRPSDKPPSASATRPPRIALLGSRGIPARYGGFETFVEELAVRLVERGIDVTVFCEGASALDAYRGVALRHVRAWAPGALRTLAFDAQCLASACRGFDVVYMLGYGSSALCFLPRVFGRRVWINMDGLEWRRSKWGPLARAWLWTMERVAFGAATHLVFDNAALRGELEQRGRRTRAASVIEYGAPIYERDDELEPLAKHGLTPGGYFLVVARLEPENHLLEIVRAHRATGSDRTLAVVTNVGRGGATERELLDAAGPRTRILGAIYDPRELRPLRRHAHAYVHGHSVGGTNPSLLEALGCGSVVLAHDNPFNRETLAGEALFWRGERDLATRLRECEELEPAEHARLRRAGLERARAHYSWERIADRYAALIREQRA